MGSFWRELAHPWEEPLFGDGPSFYRRHMSWAREGQSLADEPDEKDYFAEEIDHDRLMLEDLGGDD